jgi:hypothetical protein
MTTGDQENRRRHPRYSISLSVELYTATEVVAGIAKNLSQGGLGVALETPLAQGAQIGLSMFLVEDGIEDERTAPLNLRAEVCWSNPDPAGGTMAGLRFLAPGPTELARVRQFLQRLMTQV